MLVRFVMDSGTLMPLRNLDIRCCLLIIIIVTAKILDTEVLAVALIEILRERYSLRGRLGDLLHGFISLFCSCRCSLLSLFIVLLR